MYHHRWMQRKQCPRDNHLHRRGRECWRRLCSGFAAELLGSGHVAPNDQSFFFAGMSAGHSHSSQFNKHSCFTKVAQRSPLPLLIYNFPGVASGIDISSDIALDLSAGHPNIVGIKLTCGNVGKLARIAANLPPSRFAAMAGKADFIVVAMLAGASGGISALANVAPRVHIEALKAFRQNDLVRARQLQFALAKADGELTKLGVSGVKTAVRLAHGFGSSRARAPLPAVELKNVADFHADIRSLIQLEQELSNGIRKNLSSRI